MATIIVNRHFAGLVSLTTNYEHLPPATLNMGGNRTKTMATAAAAASSWITAARHEALTLIVAIITPAVCAFIVIIAFFYKHSLAHTCIR